VQIIYDFLSDKLIMDEESARDGIPYKAVNAAVVE